jgi:hypothetical protein
MKRCFVIGLFSLIVLSSCATILSGTKAKITVTNANVERANLTVDGMVYNNMTFPAEILVKRGFKPSVIKAETSNMEGSTTVDKSFNATYLGNILLGGIPGFIVDAADGAMMKPKKDKYSIYLYPKTNPIIETKDVIINEQVSRDNPGGTILERTIIRWYFDSEPRGARVFWRVISSVPDQVKNTNELYLGTTPYEDTRSFNILGLTYENSRDVQIEIKLVRPGYIDQMKRFNVRQAIDQQEISSFFDLVEK